MYPEDMSELIFLNLDPPVVYGLARSQRTLKGLAAFRKSSELTLQSLECGFQVQMSKARVADLHDVLYLWVVEHLVRVAVLALEHPL